MKIRYSLSTLILALLAAGCWMGVCFEYSKLSKMRDQLYWLGSSCEDYFCCHPMTDIPFIIWLMSAWTLTVFMIVEIRIDNWEKK